MIQTVRVSEINEEEDRMGVNLLNQLKNQPTSKVRSVRVYRLEGINSKDAKYLADKLLSESISQKYSVNKPLFKNSSASIEIAYKPGVMNPEAASILKAASDLGIKPKACDSSWEYNFFGKLNYDELEKEIGKMGLYNPLIEYILSKPPNTLLIKGKVGKTTRISIRKMNDEEIMELSKDKLFLNLSEMKVIQDYYKKEKKDPTDCELETLAQTWSEHCAHKTFKAKLIVDGKNKEPLIERIKREAWKHDKHIISAFMDNSGVMEFYDGMSICAKVETHNSPSAIEPYGGAMTGSGGVFRDILGTGLSAKTIASTDIFCFANPNMPSKMLPPGCLPPDYLLKRVVMGVRDYGNRMGIPTNNGSVHFHDDFRAKPTVIVGAYGIIPTKKAKKGKPKKGDVVVVAGGRTGRDGIHGATFSSAEMTDKTITVNSSAVQIGNAIEEKRMFDAILEARDLNLIRAIQDCGAGGFSSAIGEMGEKLGVRVDLSKAPLKYQGLAPWEIWVSESQERMALAVAKKNAKKLFEIFKKYNVEGAVLGTFDGSKKLRVYFGKKLVGELDMKFLHHGLPQRIMKATKPKALSLNEHEPIIPKNQNDWLKVLKKVLSHGNVNSKEPVVRMYDHSVQATNDLQPFSGEKLDGPNDGVVLRPILNKNYGAIISHGINPILNRIDPYWGSIWAGVEGLSNYVSVGGNIKEASLINNYIWPFPDEESLWSLDRSVDAVIEVMRKLKIPVISGKDSLSSTYRKGDTVIKIPPVLCMSVFGKIKDASKTVSSDFKKPGPTICLVGNLQTEAMGGSTYFDVNGLLGNKIPQINLSEFSKVSDAIYKGIQSGKILSCHDISEGGLITSVFEMCVGGDMGADLDIGRVKRPDHCLFNETSGTFTVEVEDKKTAREIFGKVPFQILGRSRKDKKINVKATRNLFSAELYDLKNAWQAPMKKIFP